jgi:hypothetical protein
MALSIPFCPIMVDVTSPVHSLTCKKANKRRTLALSLISPTITGLRRIHHRFLGRGVGAMPNFPLS